MMIFSSQYTTLTH